MLLLYDIMAEQLKEINGVVGKQKKNSHIYNSINI